MPTVIKHKIGSGAPLASDLVEGELGIDTVNGRAYTENSVGSIVELGSNPTSLTTPTINNSTGVSLQYNGSTKAATTSTGIDVTGTVTADGLTVDGSLTDLLFGKQAFESNHFIANNFNPATSTVGNASYYTQAIEFNGTGSGNGVSVKTSSSVGIAPVERMRVDYLGDISFYDDAGTTAKFFWDASASTMQVFYPSSNSYSTQIDTSDGNSHLRAIGTGSILTLDTNGSERMRVDASGNVGIGTSSISHPLHVEKDTGSGGYAVAGFRNNAAAGQGNGIIVDVTNTPNTYVADFRIGGSSKMRIDSSGNLLVGKTSADGGVAGCELRPDKAVFAATSTDPLYLNRLSTDGAIISLQKDGTNVGSIANYNGGNSLFINGKVGTTHYLGLGGTLHYAWDNAQFYPVIDGGRNLGHPSYRWGTVYAATALINTSDRNLKQDIRDITEAEKRVAMACKGLMKAYRFKDAVASKGDSARIHFGIIAQDLQAAFEAEGLDASRYAVFCSDTWKEWDVVDAEGAVVKYTDKSHPYMDIPNDAVEVTQLGVRYEELLAFIIAAI